MPADPSTATVQSIWDEGMEDIPDYVLDEMAYEGRIWLLQEQIRFPYVVKPSQTYTYLSREIKRAEYRARDTGDGRHFIIEGRMGGDWERVGHIVK